MFDYALRISSKFQSYFAKLATCRKAKSGKVLFRDLTIIPTQHTC